MKQYKFELIIKEGNCEFWEEINKSKSSGTDRVQELLLDALSAVGWDEYNSVVKLVEFKDK